MMHTAQWRSGIPSCSALCSPKQLHNSAALTAVHGSGGAPRLERAETPERDSMSHGRLSTSPLCAPLFSVQSDRFTVKSPKSGSAFYPKAAPLH